MRALVCESWRDFDQLEMKDIPPPPLRPGGVRVKVAAAGISFAMQLVVAGKYQRKPPLPFVPGTELVGIVLESAADIGNPLPLGTRVFAVADWGALAEEAVVDAIHVVPVPDGLPLEAAVAFPISYPTAGSALLWRARLQPGQWLLVQGAAGGVGLAAVEIAKALGAHVIARAGAAKHAMLVERGADVVLDVLGGAAFDEGLRCLADGGTLLTMGYAAGGIPQLGVNRLLLKNIAGAGVNWGSYVGWSPGYDRHDWAPQCQGLWAQLVAWWQAGLLRPEVHAAYPLARFREAMAEVRERRSAGRVVVRPGEA
jgi:NADPH2:quinone reductase